MNLIPLLRQHIGHLDLEAAYVVVCALVELFDKTDSELETCLANERNEFIHALALVVKERAGDRLAVVITLNTIKKDLGYSLGMLNVA